MNPHSSQLLSCEGLSKRVGGNELFDGLSFSCTAGATALVGKNGAGKSTLLFLLTGMSFPDKGKIKIAGFDLHIEPVQAKKRIAYVPDESVAYDFMTGTQFLLLVCVLRNMQITPQDHALVDTFGLSAALNQKFINMSLGTKKKLMLVAGLIGAPQVVLMDEPTNGLDVRSKEALAQIINENKADHLFFFSTHDEWLIRETAAAPLRLKRPDSPD